VRCVVESSPLGTGGALVLARGEIRGPSFLALNGDTLFPVNLREMVAVQQRSGGVGTLALSRVDDGSDYGQVELSEDGRILNFLEKGTRSTVGLVSGGLYLLTTAIFDYAPTGHSLSLEREVFPAVLSSGARLNGYVASVSHYDIGTPERYAGAAAAIKAWKGSERGR
jgi:NDP-sugar pyrophosphorylase family protein